MFKSGLPDPEECASFEQVFGTKAASISMLASWGWISTVMGGVPARILTLKLGCPRGSSYWVYYAYLSSMMSHLFMWLVVEEKRGCSTILGSVSGFPMVWCSLVGPRYAATRLVSAAPARSWTLFQRPYPRAIWRLRASSWISS